MKSESLNFNWNQFKEELINSKYWTILTGNLQNPIIGIFPTGSCLTGIRDERSDIDLWVLVDSKDKLKFHYPHYLKWNGIKVHWHYRTLNAAHISDIMHWTGYIQVGNLELEDAIYINSEYKKTLDLMMNAKKDLATKAALILLNKGKSHMQDALNLRFESKTLSKLFFHYLFAYSLLTKQEFDEDLLLQIKRIRHLPRSSTVIQFLKRQFTEILTYLNQYGESDFQNVYTDFDMLLRSIDKH